METKRKFPARVSLYFTKIESGDELTCIEHTCPVYGVCTKKGKVVGVYAPHQRVLGKFKPENEEILLEKIKDFE